MISGRLARIYKKLYFYFGPQHWWPAESHFEVMVGAILTQNTNWQNVTLAIGNLKRQKLLSARKLYKLPQTKLARLIRSAGYYNIKARRLKNFLSFFIREYGADVKKMSRLPAEDLRRQLLGINGVGPETADSILLYALNKPVFVVDAYTKRIFSRHGFIGEGAGYEETQKLFMRGLNPALSRNKNNPKTRKGWVKLFNEYHALIVKLGKDFCLKNKPRCEACPLK